ncbi:murein hydrolase activator EnvC family protein [Ruminiclostridium cellulolyticum]|uniref:Peptidase M23 n=1 Tax=Ruminiclostridium cellulolyticum (strain ATCC 35319 / DSM 5812 / JCM 6584 / H10) TaxID=394503 RepID=B8I899_RUMCH|nr:peptidoglycan DD-metalloendopeptidase family protein [Ruminiclostridium cellulolyticum]ACL77199.1 Peptidase M23 [Ruminiclostridium cellulolyticum H10]
MKKRLTLLMVIFYIFSCVVIPASATTLDKAKEQQKNVKGELNQIAGEKKALSNQIEQGKEDKENLESQAQKAQNSLKKKSVEVSDVKADIERITKEIEQIDEDYKAKTELFKTRMRIMYQNMNQSPFEVFVESKSLSEFFTRLEIISLVKENDNKLIQEIITGRESTELQKQDKLRELQEKNQQLKTLTNKVSDIKNTSQKVQSEIEASKSKLKDLEKKEDEMIALSKELAKKITKLSSTTAKYAGGVLSWPTPGYTRISSPYGNRIHPIYKVRKFHTGIDIDAASGATIIAANSGRVIMAGWNGGYGNCVIIDHGGGLATLYAHQSKILVQVGDYLKKGDTVGKVGSTGLSTGPHLHFEVRKAGDTKDPLAYYK